MVNHSKFRWDGRTLGTIVLFLFLGSLSGCASISRGITEAFIGESNEKKIDTRECSVIGSKFPGIKSSIDRQHFSNSKTNKQATLKVLMVHGIGKHLQGYSTRMAENLAKAMNLNVAEAKTIELQLESPEYPDQEIGKLRVRRFTTKEEDKEMLFYELTWSEITDSEKEILAYDNSGEQSFRRANINNAMKVFMNSHVSDPLIYLGESQEKIQIAVGQSFCWMLSYDWPGLDAVNDTFCNVIDADYLTEADDDFAFITHSMGSRIVTDSLQRIVELIEDERIKNPLNENLNTALQHLANKTVPVYMLANQLPLLQLGRSLPEVSNQYDEYCKDGSRKNDERFLKELQVIAFSDPNDILSYMVPPKFVDDYLDSRLCTILRNVIINVAEVVDLFGLGQMASPVRAHGDYDNDERVVNLIARGIGNEHVAPIVEERCTWLETR